MTDHRSYNDTNAIFVKSHKFTVFFRVLSCTYFPKIKLHVYSIGVFFRPFHALCFRAWGLWTDYILSPIILDAKIVHNEPAPWLHSQTKMSRIRCLWPTHTRWAGIREISWSFCSTYSRVWLAGMDRGRVSAIRLDESSDKLAQRLCVCALLSLF